MIQLDVAKTILSNTLYDISLYVIPETSVIMFPIKRKTANRNVKSFIIEAYRYVKLDDKGCRQKLLLALV